MTATNSSYTLQIVETTVKHLNLTHLNCTCILLFITTINMNNKFIALQNDSSSGSEEINENNEDEETTAVLPTAPGPDEHLLQYTYSIWFSKRPPGKNVDPASFEKNMKIAGIFSSVEQFWKLYSHMKRVNELQHHNDIHLFKYGIKPLWEDEANKCGGKWVVRLRKGLVARCWENLVLAILGEQFMVGDEICGAVVSIRFQEDIIAIWNKTSSDTQVTQRIRDTLSRVLYLPANTAMEYKKHNDSIKYTFKKFDRFLETNQQPEQGAPPNNNNGVPQPPQTNNKEESIEH